MNEASSESLPASPIVEHSIYALIDPDTSEVRYVGQTRLSIGERLRHHCRNGRKSYTVSWIKSLQRRKLRPLIILLAKANSQQEADRLETFLIEQHKQNGCVLTNHDLGGQGLRIISQATRDKNAASQRGKKESAEHRAKISAAMKGRPKSAETRARMSAGQTGRKFSAQHIENLSRSHKGQIPKSLPYLLTKESRAKGTATRMANFARRKQFASRHQLTLI